MYPIYKIEVHVYSALNAGRVSINNISWQQFPRRNGTRYKQVKKLLHGVSKWLKEHIRLAPNGARYKK